MDIVEAIIELFFANIAFVILIAGGIYSFFKRMKETRPQAKPLSKDRVKEPPKQTVSPFGVPLKPENVKEMRKREHQTVAVKKYERPQNVDEKMKTGKFSTRYQDKEEAIFNTFEVDQQELQKAVIWSEILGKPKALQKRP